MATPAKLVEELLKFSARDRAEAARTLLESLDGCDDPAEVEAAWRDEIAKRVAEIEDGTVELEDGPTVMRQLRERAQDRRDQKKR